MHTYLTHSISLAMVPTTTGKEALKEFIWHAKVVEPEEAYALIHEARNTGRFSNQISLDMMDAIVADEAGRHGVVIPTRHDKVSMSLAVGDTMLVVRYHGRKLTETDRTLPKGARLTFYKIDMVPVKEDPVAELINSL